MTEENHGSDPRVQQQPKKWIQYNTSLEPKKAIKTSETNKNPIQVAEKPNSTKVSLQEER